MEIKSNINHFFFDGYEIKNDKLCHIEIISDLLNDINMRFIQGKGQCITIPYFGNQDILDDGISGIVLGNDFHFTCHTYSHLNTIFVDLYSGQTIDKNEIITTLKKYFEVNKYDLCMNNEVLGNFGKHIIIKTDKMKYQKALTIIDQIIENINMHPIYENISDFSNDTYDLLRPIAESHISIHCHEYCLIDIFSCNTFDEKKIVRLFNNIDSIRSVERGVYFDKNEKI